jgi:hypothetical protein
MKSDILSDEYLHLLPVGLIIPQKELTQWPTHTRVIRDSLLLTFVAVISRNKQPTAGSHVSA